MVTFILLLVLFTGLFAQEVPTLTLREHEVLTVIPGMRVRIKAPSINRALIGVPWITGSLIEANADTLVLRSETDDLMVMPLSAVQKFQVKVAKHWQEVSISQTGFLSFPNPPQEPFGINKRHPCWKKPSPACPTFLITEFAVTYRLFSSLSGWREEHLNKVFTRERFYVTTDLGLMKNLNNHYALGSSLLFGYEHRTDLRGGLKLRVRRWLGTQTSIDLLPGVILWAADITDDEGNPPWFTGSIDLKMKEWFALSTTLEYRHSHPFYYIGVKSGSRPGLIIPAAGLPLGAVASLLLFGLE